MPAAAFDRDRLRVVLVNPRNPLNIGAAARAMSNFGFFDLRLVSPYDVAYREARSAVGAAALLEKARVFDSVAGAIADSTLVVGTTSSGRRALNHPLRRLEYGARFLRKHLAAGNVALLFGSEKFGLSNDDMAHCHWLVRIPTREEHGSMNLGQAVALCLYELIRDARAVGCQTRPPQAARAADLERIGVTLGEVLERSGYLNPRTAASSANKLRRLVRRMNLSARDADVLMGMVRQILWKLTPTTR